MDERRRRWCPALRIRLDTQPRRTPANSHSAAPAQAPNARRTGRPGVYPPLASATTGPMRSGGSTAIHLVAAIAALKCSRLMDAARCWVAPRADKTAAINGFRAKQAVANTVAEVDHPRHSKAERSPERRDAQHLDTGHHARWRWRDCRLAAARTIEIDTSAA